MRYLLFLLCPLWLLACAAPSPAQQAEPVVAFVDVNVLPMDKEGVLAAQTVVVGGKNSSNTKELAVKCREICADTVHVEYTTG